MGVVHLYFSRLGQRKSLGRSLVRFDLLHSFDPLSTILIFYFIGMCLTVGQIRFRHRSFVGMDVADLFLQRYDEHGQRSSFKNRLLFYCSCIGKRLGKLFKQLQADFLVSHLTALEADSHAHLVTVI